MLPYRQRGGITMNERTYEKGVFTITDQFLHFFGTTLNLSKIDNMDFITFPRHSYLNGVKEWLVGFVVMLIICAIWKNLVWLGDLYILTIFALIGYNIYKHRVLYHGLKIETGARKKIVLKCEDLDFLNRVHDAIIEGMSSRKANYTINFDDHSITNNGIISKGDHNINKMEGQKNDK